MAKISELPVVAAPNGAETVVVLDGGETRRATIGGLVEGAVETAAASSYRAVATYGEREAIPLSRRKPGLAVRVLEAGPDGGRVFLWNPELLAPGAWTGLLTQEESTRLDIMHGGLAQDRIYGLSGTLAAMSAETAKAAKVVIGGVRAEVQAGTAIVTWARSGGQPDAQSVAWGGWTLPIRAGAQRFEARDWSRIDRLFVVGNSLSDTTGANDQWSQLLAADLNVPLVSTARGSSDARQVYKAGARAINLTLAGPLPSNGSVAITQINGSAPGWDNPASFLNSYGGDATPAAMDGWASDGQVSRRVTVSIARSDSFAYRVSQVGGDAVAFAGAVLFTPDAAREPERSLTCIWIGNNYWYSGVANFYGDHTNPVMWIDMDALVRAADGGRIFILPILPSATMDARGPGSPYDAYLAANARTKALYPRYWLVDAQGRDLIAYMQAIGSDGSEGDRADIAAGFIPRSCRSDDLHLNGKGRALVRDFVKAALPRQALPPPIVEGTAVTVSAMRGGESASALAIATDGSIKANQIADGGGKVMMTATERAAIAGVITNSEYRPTLASAVADFAIGTFFVSDDRNGEGPFPNQKRRYRIIAAGPGWADEGLFVEKSDVGLANADDTADTDKPVSTAQADAITESARLLEERTTVALDQRQAVTRQVRTLAELVAAAISNAVLQIPVDAAIVVNDNVQIRNAANLTILGPGRIKVGAAGALVFVGCRDLNIDGITVVGALSSMVQFRRLVQGVSIGSVPTAMQTPTFGDTGGAIISGTDFIHSLDGSVLSVSLGAGFAGFAVTRTITSAPIALDPAKRYVINPLADFYAGDGGRAPRFLAYDAAGNLLGDYPFERSGNFMMIRGASSLRVELGVQRWDTTANNLTCAYDLSKIEIYELVNDLATLPLVSPVESSSPLFFSFCDRVKVRRCSFEMIERAAVKTVSCASPTFERNRIRFCYGGIGTQDSTGETRVVYNDIDLRMAIESGGMLGQRALRTHCVSSPREQNITVAYNVMRGASWACEILNYNDNWRHHVVYNDIEAEMQGVSGVVGGWSSEQPNVIRGNTIRLTSMCSHGIEMSANELYRCRTDCDDNVVMIAGIGVGGPAIAGSGSFVSLNIRRNILHATAGIVVVQSQGKVHAIDNSIQHAGVGIRIGNNDVLVQKNTIRSPFIATWAGAPHAAIMLDPQAYFFGQRVVGNEYDATATYGGLIAGSNQVEWSDNIVSVPSFSGTIDIHRFSTTSQAYPTRIQFTNNRMRTPTGGFQSRATRLVGPGNVFTGSSVLSTGNLFNGRPDDRVIGFDAIVAPAGVAAILSWSPGAIAATTSVRSAPITLGYGLFKHGDRVQVRAPFDLFGLTVTAYITSPAVSNYDANQRYTGTTSAQAVIVITNLTGATVTLPAGTWTIAADQVT